MNKNFKKISMLIKIKLDMTEARLPRFLNDVTTYIDYFPGQNNSSFFM